MQGWTCNQPAQQGLLTSPTLVHLSEMQEMCSDAEQMISRMSSLADDAAGLRVADQHARRKAGRAALACVHRSLFIRHRLQVTLQQSILRALSRTQHVKLCVMHAAQWETAVHVLAGASLATCEHELRCCFCTSLLACKMCCAWPACKQRKSVGCAH